MIAELNLDEKTQSVAEWQEEAMRLAVDETHATRAEKRAARGS